MELLWQWIEQVRMLEHVRHRVVRVAHEHHGYRRATNYRRVLLGKKSVKSLWRSTLVTESAPDSKARPETCIRAIQNSIPLDHRSLGGRPARDRADFSASALPPLWLSCRRV
jgi:hypothetical protein